MYVYVFIIFCPIGFHQVERMGGKKKKDGEIVHYELIMMMTFMNIAFGSVNIFCLGSWRPDRSKTNAAS